MGVAKSTSTTVLVNPKEAKAFEAERMPLHSVDKKAAISECIEHLLMHLYRLT